MENEVRLSERTLLTLQQAAKYTGVGVNKLRQISNEEESLVVWIGTKRMLKRRMLEAYLEATYSI